jgi:hypothetical protein
MTLPDPRTITLVLFPGETTVGDTTRGHLYARRDDQLVKTIEACAGPGPGHGRADRGGHTAEKTPAGDYRLARGEHHTTQNWPLSAIPWGARLRPGQGGAIDYSPDDGASWLPATGLDGAVSRAAFLFEERTRAGRAADERKRTGLHSDPAPLTDEERRSIDQSYRALFFPDGTLLPRWNRNDFGPWAWNLTLPTKSGPVRTAYYLHTTPADEAATAEGRAFELSQSHGCVHIRPADRDALLAEGLIQRGVRFLVRPYGVVGP